ncbi:MAG: alkaline phosphatase family protein [Actinobacteria bacterium]|nr:alkaline phosphatase family protein [Actinomycetota bacterium]MBV8396150.1 alkaline phosphatase family protein [Actinomycetota bacterium]MBV8598022.1 alkaline phosphatase family protein [Actinomycetota bacterium]
MSEPVPVNGRLYRRPQKRTAVFCLDGVDPAYLEDAFDRGLTPRIAELADAGTFVLGLSQLPSFTNPNNLSIVTGAPPSVHGLPGNHYLAPDGEEVQLDRADQLRAPTILAALGDAGTRVLAVTTKEKLRKLLGSGSVDSVSAECADKQSLPGMLGSVARAVGRPQPDIYAWDASHYALELAFALADRFDVEVLYVSLTDAVQHAAAPGDELSDAYLRRLDELVGAYLDAGWELGLVADHGMNAKADIRYLGEELHAFPGARVVLPITDPYVVHHAALGSACWVHVDGEPVDACAATLRAVEGVEQVLTRDEAADALHLPADRIGDLVVLGDDRTVFGKRPEDHDLSKLRGPLRSHGGRHEQSVPIILSTRPALPELPVANSDVFWLLLGEAA